MSGANLEGSKLNTGEFSEPEKYYLETSGRAEREAVFQVMDELQEIRDASGKKAFSFDESEKKWFTHNLEALNTARELVQKEIACNPEKYHNPDIEQGKETEQKIPLKIDSVPFIELRATLKNNGCYFNEESKAWVAPDEKTAKEMQALIDAAPGSGKAVRNVVQQTVAESHEPENQNAAPPWGM